MKETQEERLHRVRAVRSWLERAESSFAREADIKGELNLMLAEAEMKNLRRHQDRRKTVYCLLAFVMAIFLVTSLYVFTRQQAPQPLRQRPQAEKEAAVPAAEKPLPPADRTPPATLAPAAAPESTASQMPEAAPQETAAPPERTPASLPAETAGTEKSVPASAARSVLSQQQMQDTVQEARHTLRGTDIMNQ